jgi:hypothetical protein
LEGDGEISPKKKENFRDSNNEDGKWMWKGDPERDWNQTLRECFVLLFLANFHISYYPERQLLTFHTLKDRVLIN